MKRITLAAAASLCLGTFAAHAADELPPGVTLVPPDKVKWIKAKDGRDYSVLLGHPAKAGPYLLLVKWPPNSKALAHTHPDTRYGMVVSGVHYIGYGDKFDESKLHAHTAGTFFTEPANTPHFGMTKGEGAVLYFYSVGPSGSKPLE
jgi:uncharacterized RmlC-like cupin family protein